MTNWRIEVKPSAEKQYLKLDKKTRKRLKLVLRELEEAENPLLHPRVRPLAGKLKGDYRVRVGDWRILFAPDREIPASSMSSRFFPEAMLTEGPCRLLGALRPRCDPPQPLVNVLLPVGRADELHQLDPVAL